MVGIIIVFMTLYAVLPILSPIAFELGAEKLGKGIQVLYRGFCHQAVERSLFLFPEGSEFARFYSVEELKELNYIPEESYSGNAPWSVEHIGFPFWGNDQIGYKVAYCIRDIALYTALAITMIVVHIIYGKNRRKDIDKLEIPLWLYGVLILPMAIDGVFQTIIEYVRLDFVPDGYVDNIPKRIVTGALFGIGFGLFIIVSLKKSVKVLYNETDEERKRSES